MNGIQHIDSKDNVVADGLSRVIDYDISALESFGIDITELAQVQRTDDNFDK